MDERGARWTRTNRGGRGEPVTWLLQSLAAQVEIDMVTGVGNRRAFGRALVAEAGAARRAAQPLALLLVAPDGFAALGREHGIAFGEELLRSFVWNVQALLGDGTRVYRFEGETFAALAPGLDFDEAMDVASVVAEAIGGMPLGAGRRLVDASCGIGVASLEGEESWIDLVARAFGALQQAQAQGPGRACGVLGARRVTTVASAQATAVA